MMYSATLIIFSIVSLSYVKAIEYPARVDPNSCPNYPFCLNNGNLVNNQIPPRSDLQYSPQQQSYRPSSYQPQQNNLPQYQPQQYQPQQYQSQNQQQYQINYQQQPQQYQTGYQQQPQQYQTGYQQQPQQYQTGHQQQPHQYQTGYQQQPQQYQVPVSNNQYYNPAQNTQHSAEIQKALDRGDYIGDGDYHGEGLAEALAPGYEGYAQGRSTNDNNSGSYRSNQNPAQVAPLASRYPAGVDPNFCPNYPYCS